MFIPAKLQTVDGKDRLLKNTQSKPEHDQERVKQFFGFLNNKHSQPNCQTITLQNVDNDWKSCLCMDYC